MESHDGIPKDLPRFKILTIVILTILVIGAFAGLFFAGFLPHRHQEERLRAEANEQREALPVVEVTAPKPMPSVIDVSLPGDARAMRQTALYARISGYLKLWLVDINDHVEKGQLLAEIDAPDIDAQLAQANAARDQAKANANSADVNNKLAQSTYQRYNGLLASGSVTQQNLDQYKSSANQAESSLNAANASTKAADATVQQLEAQKNFEKIYAPFSGTITARNYDVGALLSPGNTAAGAEIFDIAETDKLRIYVKVPQSYVTLIQDRQPADFLVRNYPGQAFHGIVSRSAGVLDPNTRTLLTEVDVDNGNGKLWAGMYGDIHFKLNYPTPSLTVPTSALLFEAEGTQVAVVRGDKLHFQKVTVGRDFGTEIEIMTGLTGKERVVANPGEKLAEGKQVEVQSPKAGAPEPPGAGQQAEPTRASAASASPPATAASARLPTRPVDLAEGDLSVHPSSRPTGGE